MLTPSDLIHLPYTPDLTEGGIAYACRSLAYTYDRMGGTAFDRLRRIVGGVAVELAFRRYLTEQSVPFDVLGATPFTDPDRYDVSLGGHRCDLKSFLITRRAQIAQMRKDASLGLQAAALIPMDQFAAEGHTSQDIYLFAFLLALTTPSQEELRKAIAARQPLHLIHPLPDDWARPRLWQRSTVRAANNGGTPVRDGIRWQPLEKLALKSECEQPISVEIGGMDAARNFVTAALELPPKTRLAVEVPFHTVAYIHARRLPEARLGIHSPRRGEALIVQPHEWGNIWVYGLDIWLTGWLAHEDYRHKASVLPIGSRIFQYDQTRVKNLAVPISELRPLGNLFERVREWELTKQKPGF
ncbi:MAG: hypothetical protein QMD04_02645 [Anaerolineales bacterium]|nr:hypothetical protein [Anaerolineales bacterium]